MASVGPKYPLNVYTLQESGDDNDWVSAISVGADDTVYANITAASFDSPDTSYLMQCSNFAMGVPAGATINGILVEIERYYANGRCNDYDVVLTKDASARAGSDRSTGAIFTTSPAIVSFGGATDLWDTTWTAAEVNASTFGVFYKMQATDANADGFLDFIRVTVYYTSGAQTFYQTMPATTTGVSVVSKLSTRYMALSAVVTGVSSLTKQMYQTLAASVAGITTLTKANLVSLVLATTTTGVSILTKIPTYAQSLAATAAGVTTLTRANTFYRGLAVTVAGVATLARVATFYRTLGATLTGVPGLATAYTALRALGATVSGAASLAKQFIAGGGTTFYQTLAASVTAIPALSVRLSATIARRVMQTGRTYGMRMVGGGD